MPPVKIVELGPDAVDEVVALWEAAGLTRPWNDPRADFRAALACAEAAMLGAETASMLAGTVMAGYDGHRGWLYYLAVAADRRREGVGTALVRAAEAWLAGRGAPKVQLMMRDGNDAAGFYRALGYEEQPVAVFGRRLRES